MVVRYQTQGEGHGNLELVVSQAVKRVSWDPHLQLVYEMGQSPRTEPSPWGVHADSELLVAELFWLQDTQVVADNWKLSGEDIMHVSQTLIWVMASQG